MFWFVNCLHDDSNTPFVVRVFGVVAIQKSNPLFGHMFFLNPMFDHFGKSLNVHEFHIIHMSKFLPLDNNIRRDTFIAHCFRIGFMILAASINFILNLGRRKAVTAFNFRRMDSFAL